MIYEPTDDEILRYGGSRSAHLNRRNTDPSLCGSITRGLGYRNLAGRLAAMGGGKALPYDKEVQWLALEGGHSTYFDTGYSMKYYCEAEFMMTASNMYGGIGNIILCPDCNNFFYSVVRWGNTSSLRIGQYMSVPDYSSGESCFNRRLKLENTGLAQGNYKFVFFAKFLGDNPSTASDAYGLTIQVNYLYNYKVYDSDRNLIADCIPVVKDGVGFFYDKINETFHGVTGNQPFNIGPDV